MGNLLESYKMDKTRMTVGSSRDESDERAYWHSRTPAERLLAVEFLRQVMYGYNPATERLQRVLEVAQRELR